MNNEYKKLWAFIKVNLNFSDNEIERLSFEEIKYLKDELIKKWQREDSRFALVCATLCNINSPKGARKVAPKDFIPKYAGQEFSAKPLSEEAVRKKVESMHLAITGQKIDKWPANKK